MSEKKEIVILGAGLGGGPLASLLGSMKLSNANITVVDKSETSVLKFGGARATVLGDAFSHRVTVPNQKLIPASAGKVIHEEVEGIDPENSLVKLKGEAADLKYDYLVLATGATSNSPAEPPASAKTFAAQQAHFKQVSDKIKSADKIIIVGGGPVGAEISGEILENYPKKTVSIVSSGNHMLSTLLPALNIKMVQKLEAKMKKIGINLYLDQKLEGVELSEFGDDNTYDGAGKTYKTTKGTEIQADLIISSVGTNVRSGFVPESWKNEATQVKVNEFFQVKDGDKVLENVFALGDITDLAEAKQGYLAGGQASLLGNNLKKILTGKPKKTLKAYKLNTTTMLAVPLGRSKGQGFFGIHAGNFLTSAIKGKDLFLTPLWKKYNMSDMMVKEKDPQLESKVKKLADMSS